MNMSVLRFSFVTLAKRFFKCAIPRLRSANQEDHVMNDQRSYVNNSSSCENKA